MPIEYAEAVKVYNKEICDALGLDIVDGYESIIKKRLFDKKSNKTSQNRGVLCLEL